MPNPVRLCLALHNHQPVGNFDGVFEQAYQDSYLPFLEIFEEYSDLKISLHTSGPLMEWFHENHPEYLDRVAALIADGRVEILGGAFYEPILTMIPSPDRRGQIADYSAWLGSRLGAEIRGMWIPERVWEQSLTSDIAAAGISYTILDDFHFQNAGVDGDQLFGHYVTEDEGQILYIFPGSERLRYLIPFQPADEIVGYLRHIGETQENAVLVFGDDGEKFGTWPNTKEHVYGNGWLRRFFDALSQNKDWLYTTTLSSALEDLPPVGKVYLPEGSYREMTEWALPREKQADFDRLSHSMEEDHRWRELKTFVRGGYWRNFKVKYTETDEMYSRMMAVSKRLRLAEQAGHDRGLLMQARQELYRGQCNCSYWHGAFGGVYLPHLRNAIYKHLISADNLLDRAENRPINWVEATADDYNFDGSQEIRVENNKLICLLAPKQGGQLYELDVRSICHNLSATLTRRPEIYHQKVLAGPSDAGGDVASIHDLVVFKQDGLDEHLQYDTMNRKSLVDRFYHEGVTLEGIRDGNVGEKLSFFGQPYEARIRRKEGRAQVMLTNFGELDGNPIKLTKGVTLDAGSSVLEIAYMIEGLPQNQGFLFGVEFNFAGLPSGQDDRYFSDADGNKLGQLQTELKLHDETDLNLTDEWLGIRLGFSVAQPATFWTFPIQTVSQSEGGFELVHQSVCVHPLWHVVGDEKGVWNTTMRLDVDTSLAESRLEQQIAPPATVTT
jgi:alpha-amylase